MERLTKPKPLTVEMQALIDFMAARSDRSAWRHPGGFWSGNKPPTSFSTTFGASTVQALVTRGVAEYTRHQKGKSGDFPVCATLRVFESTGSTVYLGPAGNTVGQVTVVDTTKPVTMNINVHTSPGCDPVTVKTEGPDHD